MEGLGDQETQFLHHLDWIERYHLPMNIHWPPPPLGLGTLLNLASISPETRPILRRLWLLVPGFGLAIPLLMLGIDRVFFAGVSMQRIRELGSQPLGYRIMVTLYSGITEELIYRLIVATLFAWLAHLAFSRFISEPEISAQWFGILVSALLFGLAHVGNLPDVAQPVLRAVTINGVAGLFLGWLYWWRGLEAAILTHMFAIVVLYIAVPLLL